MGEYWNKPPDQTVTVTYPDGGKVQAKLKWNDGFVRRFDEQYYKAQKYLDSRVVQFGNHYVRKVTGALQGSGVTGTKAGTGKVIWRAKYARRQYYLPEPPKNSKNFNPLGGSYWFQRMWSVNGDQIVNETVKIAGGGA